MHSITRICLVVLSFCFGQSEVEQIVCDKYSIIGDELLCVTESENRLPLVQIFKIKADHFVETNRFTASHSNVEEVTTDFEDVYCSYRNGVVERRDRDSLETVSSSLKLESENENVVMMGLFHDFNPAKSITIESFSDFRGPSSDQTKRRLTRAIFKDKQASQVWQLTFPSIDSRVEFDRKGNLYLSQPGEVKKLDLATGNVVAQLSSDRRCSRFLNDGTLVFSSDGIYEFWDFENRILKRSAVIPNATFQLEEFFSVRSSDGKIQFVDLQGNPISKFKEIETQDERVRSVRDGKITLINSKTSSFRILDMVTSKQIAAVRDAHDIYQVTEDTILVTETVDDDGNLMEPPGGCSPGPYPKYRFSLVPLKRAAPGTKE